VSNFTTNSIIHCHLEFLPRPNTDVATPLATPNCCS